jgi:hypothetical protein
MSRAHPVLAALALASFAFPSRAAAEAARPKYDGKLVTKQSASKFKTLTRRTFLTGKRKVPAPLSAAERKAVFAQIKSLYTTAQLAPAAAGTKLDGAPFTLSPQKPSVAGRAYLEYNGGTVRYGPDGDPAIAVEMVATTGLAGDTQSGIGIHMVDPRPQSVDCRFDDSATPGVGYGFVQFTATGYAVTGPLQLGHAFFAIPGSSSGSFNALGLSGPGGPSVVVPWIDCTFAPLTQ